MPLPINFTCRLLALDVDGTLLNSRGVLTERTRNALREAAAAGIHLVVATGRRYRRALPLVEPLGIEVPLVTHSGALIKDAQDHRTRYKATLPKELARAVLDELDRLGYPAVVYQDRHDERVDFLTPLPHSGRIEFDEYLDMNRDYYRVQPDLMRAPPAEVYALCVLGERDEMLRVEQALHHAVPGALGTHVLRSPRYRGELCEVMRADATKWSAIRWLARRWDVPPEQICAVGDDVNDVAMLTGAGLGVAMGHAPEAVRAVADHVTDTHDEQGLANLVEELLRGGIKAAAPSRRVYPGGLDGPQPIEKRRG